MEQSTRDETGRRAVGAALRAVRRALGLDPPAPAVRHPPTTAHGTWQVCGIGPSAADGQAELSRR